jgi:hypothetical protein
LGHQKPSQWRITVPFGYKNPCWITFLQGFFSYPHTSP